MTRGTSRYAVAQDGLTLHYRDIGPPDAEALPVLCLPGLARTADDFEPLAHLLAAGADAPPRRVLAIDCRGRGASARDPHSDNYNVATEAADTLAVMDTAGVGEAIFVGTSRGGLITMALGTSHPERIRGAVLNDIGPVLEPAGLARIRSYLGRLPALRTWDEAVKTIRAYAGIQFTALSDDDWLAFARTTFAEQDGRLVARYDPALKRSLDRLDLSDLPTLWPQFATLGRVPLLVIRGANSDLLSADTAAEMVRRHPGSLLLTVDGQGHAPLLRDAGTLGAIAAFVRRCDGAEHPSGEPGDSPTP